MGKYQTTQNYGYDEPNQSEICVEGSCHQHGIYDKNKGRECQGDNGEHGAPHEMDSATQQICQHDHEATAKHHPGHVIHNEKMHEPTNIDGYPKG